MVLAGALDSGSDAYVGGFIDWVDTATMRHHIRPIIEVVDTPGQAEIFIAGVLPTVMTGDVDLVKGCAHTEEACTKWHNNVANYGGQLWIPDLNPVGNISTFL